MNDYIRVTDRRGGGWYAVSNSILDEWFPIIDRAGYLLYTFYIRMARIENGDERSSPGYRLMAERFKMGKATISEYNNLLVWCRLIEIEAGDRERPNEYIILPTPSVTPAALADIEAAARFHLEQMQERQEDEARKLERGGLPKKAAELRRKTVGGKFYSTLFNRLTNWRPMPWVNVPWLKTADAGGVHPAQISLWGGSPVERGGSPVERGGSPVERGGSPVERGGSPVERGGSGSEPDQEEHNKTLKQDINNKTSLTRGNNGDGGVLADILSWIGFNGRLRQGINKNGEAYDETWVTPETLLAWAFWLKIEQSGLRSNGSSAVSILRGHLRRNTLPNRYLQDIARTWLSLDDYEKWGLLDTAWSVKNVEVWFNGRGMPTAVANEFVRLNTATGGNIAPPALMPSAEARPRHERPLAQQDTGDEIEEMVAALPQPEEWLYIIDQICAVERGLGSWLKGSGLRVSEDRASILTRNDYAVPHIERVLPRIRAVAAQMGEAWAQQIDVRGVWEEELAYAD